MINGESEAEVRAGSMLYAERLSAAVRAAQAQLTELLAGIDADMDFPEEDIEHTDLFTAKEHIRALAASLEELTRSYGTGKKIGSGVSVVLAGRPNTGKSSVLNALLGSDRAIVSAQAGTTRDAVEGSIEIGGVRFDLCDTGGAGARARTRLSARAWNARGGASKAPTSCCSCWTRRSP